MARLYHVEVARHAAETDVKWIDNLLSHFDIPGVEGGRQGVARKISRDGVRHIALIRRLNRDLRVPVSHAAAIATRLLAGESARAIVGSGLELHIDRLALDEEIDRRISEAVEASTLPRRGRPKRGVATA